MSLENNIAFIDGQNLHLGTQSENRIYLEKKYGVKDAYYFLGFLDEEQQDFYTNLQKAGFIIVFREHHHEMQGKKKGNVDVDIVFEIMRRIYEKEEFEEDFDKIVLVSGDGDCIKVVKHLIKKERLKKILFPNSKYSSLYKQIETCFRQNLSTLKHKIEYKKRGVLR